MLADMAINLELARLMTYKSAQEVDLGRPGSYWASIAKCFAADTANQTAANAVQVFFLHIFTEIKRIIITDFWWQWLQYGIPCGKIDA